jgi:hypothetical protein
MYIVVVNVSKWQLNVIIKHTTGVYDTREEFSGRNVENT